MGAESGRLMAVSIDKEISTQEIHRFQTPVKIDSRDRRCWDFPKIMDEVITALTKASATGSYGHRKRWSQLEQSALSKRHQQDLP